MFELQGQELKEWLRELRIERVTLAHPCRPDKRKQK